MGGVAESRTVFYPDYSLVVCSPTDPHPRGCGGPDLQPISQSLPVYVEGPSVTTRHYDKWLVGTSRTVNRPQGSCSTWTRTTSGQEFSFEPASVELLRLPPPARGESAENFSVADALTPLAGRAAQRRYREGYRGPDDAAESGKDSEPTRSQRDRGFKAT